MNREQLFKLYEKLYFDEVERREKTDSRLQLPLAILIVLFGVFAYMLQNVSYSTCTIAVYFFWFLFLIACGSYFLSIWFFAKSWLGYTYRLLPTPETTEKYRNDCIELYKDFDNCDELVEDAISKYLYGAYVEYSSWNMANNDSKSLNLNRTGKFLFISFIFCVLSFGPFIMGNLDKSKSSLDSRSEVSTTQIINNKQENAKCLKE